MAKCQTIRKKKQSYCVGDLRDIIVIENRTITAPTAFNQVDYDETFTDSLTVNAAVNTVNGRTYFDGVSTETPITHVIGIRFIEGLTSEQWITLEGSRLDILRIENLNQRSLWMRLTCVDRGLISKDASKA